MGVNKMTEAQRERNDISTEIKREITDEVVKTNREKNDKATKERRDKVDEEVAESRLKNDETTAHRREIIDGKEGMVTAIFLVALISLLVGTVFILS